MNRLLPFVVALVPACGCTQSLPAEVPQALAVAKCVESALQSAGDLEALDVREALDLVAHLRACAPPKAPADAGAR